jgi:ArsR family transcriptional regulator, lead/cadmium/zinc/bismuth-responsive transcriptional repressor
MPMKNPRTPRRTRAVSLARVRADDLLQPLADLFQHLSDPRRLQLLLILARGEHAVSELALHLGVTVSAVSHQLQTLRLARLVSYRREGRTCYYHLIDDHVRKLITLGREHAAEG